MTISLVYALLHLLSDRRDLISYLIMTRSPDRVSLHKLAADGSTGLQHSRYTHVHVALIVHRRTHTTGYYITMEERLAHTATQYLQNS